MSSSTESISGQVFISYNQFIIVGSIARFGPPDEGEDYRSSMASYIVRGPETLYVVIAPDHINDSILVELRWGGSVDTGDEVDENVIIEFTEPARPMAMITGNFATDGDFAEGRVPAGKYVVSLENRLPERFVVTFTEVPADLFRAAQVRGGTVAYSESMSGRVVAFHHQFVIGGTSRREPYLGADLGPSDEGFIVCEPGLVYVVIRPGRGGSRVPVEVRWGEAIDEEDVVDEDAVVEFTEPAGVREVLTGKDAADGGLAHGRIPPGRYVVAFENRLPAQVIITFTEIM